jgi:hypothetical protein
VVDRKRTAAAPHGSHTLDPATSDPDRSTTPGHDEATAAVPASHPPQTPDEDMKMPHERDESAGDEASQGRGPARTRRVMRQAHQDLADGQENTDCYDAVAPRYQAGEDEATPEGRRPSKDQPGRG